MARPKRFIEKTIVRFPDRTFETIDALLSQMEDRTGFIRTAVEREIEYRSAGLHSAVPRYLMADESENAFCVNAIRRGVEGRRAMIATEKAALPDGDENLDRHLPSETRPDTKK